MYGGSGTLNVVTKAERGINHTASSRMVVEHVYIIIHVRNLQNL